MPLCNIMEINSTQSSIVSTMVETKGLERVCRLCAEVHEVTIKLFSTEAADMLLLEKLRIYLHIEIEENDKFPKNICIKCCSKLNTLCKFIKQIREAQFNLNALSSMIEEPTINAIKKENTEVVEVCIDPTVGFNLQNEISTEQFSYSYADDVVTLRLISKNDEDQSEIEEIKKSLRYECDVCSKSFLVEQSLKNHSWIHIRDQDFSCFTCQRGFKFQSDLEKHIKSHKPVGFKHHCNICGRRFKTEISHEAHMQLHKVSAKAYTCKICGRSYPNWAGLKNHSVTHNPEKPFQCTLCDKKFKRNQELKFHMNYHTGAKPYKCKFCDRSFASTGNLYTHQSRLHNMKKRVLKCQETQTADQSNNQNYLKKVPKSLKFQCQICKKNCGRRENYVYHMYQHTGEKPYFCTRCPQKFITTRSLTLHYANVHSKFFKPSVPVPVFCPVKRKWLHLPED